MLKVKSCVSLLKCFSARIRDVHVVEDDGWCTVRRSRSRFSPLSSNNRTSKSGGNAKAVNKARDRFKVPSSAISLPSLSLPGESREAEDVPDEVTRPQLERSVTSASIIRNRRDKAKQLARVIEKAGGSSNESLENNDPALRQEKAQLRKVLKKKES